MVRVSNESRDKFGKNEIHHVKPISSFDVSEEKKIEKIFQLDR